MSDVNEVENLLASRLSALDPNAAEENTSVLNSMGLKTEETKPGSQPNSELPVSKPTISPESPKAEKVGPNDPTAETSQLLQNLSHQVEIKLADQQADPNSPLYSAQSFEDLKLRPELLKGLYRMGFQRPSKIQERALPLLLQDPPRNMIGQSQSGTGKTAAFVLTMLSRVDPSRKVPQAICVCPSRELARQILDVADQMGQYLEGVTKCLASKDTLERGQRIEAQVIVGTPGTIKDALTTHRITGTREPVIDPSGIKVLVADEADVLVGTGSLGEQCIGVKNAIGRQNSSAQIILFSATFPDHVRKYASKFAPNANEIKLKKEELTLEGIKQFYMDCNDREHKYTVLVELYQLLTIGQSIIFAQERRTADEIARRMNADGHKVAVLHGAQVGEGRDQTIDDFREGRSKVLITTNVVARGIDISQVNLVVNYDLPRDPMKGGADAETYLHRIGRTGRFGRKGISINFIHDQGSYQDMMRIKSELEISDEQLVKVDTKDFDDMEKTLKAAIKA
ncbi:P-loop containing nucleoside triphosphate hydrolase protein [Melampsora americana]|nr:P-loop containing nucleoside triphosphate hydrolase protein [Melampsora americana]